VWNNDFGPKCDVWSLGVVMFELFTGAFPFMANRMTAQAWNTLHKRGPDWTLVKVSAPGKAMCKTMLAYDEDQRPTMADCLKDPWFEAAKTDLKTVPPWFISQLEAFTKKSKTKRAMLLELASQLAMNRSQEIVDLFESIDKNRDGRVSKKELSAFLSSQGVDASSMTDKIFSVLDIDGNGDLSFSELAAGVLPFFSDVLKERVDAEVIMIEDHHDEECPSGLFGGLGAAMSLSNEKVKADLGFTGDNDWATKRAQPEQISSILVQGLSMKTPSGSQSQLTTTRKGTSARG